MIAFRTNDEMITMATLTKLLVIKIVARRRSGVSRVRSMSRDFLVFFAAMADRSAGESEKNATSEPDAKAEPVNKIIIQIMAVTIDGVRG